MCSHDFNQGTLTRSDSSTGKTPFILISVQSLLLLEEAAAGLTCSARVSAAGGPAKPVTT